MRLFSERDERRGKVRAANVERSAGRIINEFQLSDNYNLRVTLKESQWQWKKEPW